MTAQREGMRWMFDFLPEEGVLRVTTSGTVTMQGILRLAVDVRQYLEQTGAHKFLVDHRAAAIEINVGELYFLPRRAEALGIGGAYRAAFVFSKQSEHDFAFYQTRAENLGLDQRVFTDADAAFAWLIE